LLFCLESTDTPSTYRILALPHYRIPLVKVFLRKGISDRIASGHPWIFGNEIGSLDGSAEPGDVVDVFTAGGSFVGRGYFNPASQIQVRLLTRDRGEAIDAAFWHRRILAAWEYRQRLGYSTNCRLVFGEGDSLPALVIDKFGEYLVLQTLALGTDRWKSAIVDALQQIFSPAGIYERNDVPVRELEGLPQQKGFLSAPFETRIQLDEHGVKYWVDVERGQKTGFFLDQTENRRSLAQVAHGASVLEAFCYTGSFSLHAARYGAESVLGLDISETAVAAARENAELNGVADRCSFEALNAFDALKAWAREGRRYDVVVLDPPAFTKSRQGIEKAVTGYKEINLRGIKLVKPGGFLATASCTGLVTPEVFLRTVVDAARDARRTLRVIRWSGAGPDHPMVPQIPSTQYLKFLLVQVV